ncbi:RidA family protein [Rubinisphaera sp. JC750]|uniref:RidA family protein n=1 Tax=Rubinisphaera sp. JC750 TaxID=2898658 RepID=UPI001F318530|nr:RidA family protein [Rubinisphaera sp. JC750]
MSTPDEKLEALGYPLDRVPKPGPILRMVAVDGDRAYVSGAIPIDGKYIAWKGIVPTEISLEEARKAAALCAANNLRMLIQELGSLERVERIIRLTGYVWSEQDFTDQHLIMDGASQLLLDVFGPDAGLPARTALGVAALPLRASVETEMIVRLKPE